MEYIALFFTHSGAIKYDRFLNIKGFQSILMPVPRKVSSSCGIGVKFTYSEELAPIISEDIDKIFQIVQKEYILRYSCEE